MDFTIVNQQTQETLRAQEFMLNKVFFSVGDYKYSAKQQDINEYWMLCDGRYLTINEYYELYSIIGTSFNNEGTPEDMFTIPDFRGRVFAQMSENHFTGEYVGQETVILDESQMPSHNHTGTTQVAGDHIHTASLTTDGSHNHTASLTTDGNHAHQYVDAYFAEFSPGGGIYGTSANTDYDNTFRYRTANGGFSSTPSGIDTTTNGAHSHTATIASAGTHSHTATIASAGAHSHNFTTQNTGGGLPHQNMQPTLFGGNIFILAKAWTSL